MCLCEEGTHTGVMARCPQIFVSIVNLYLVRASAKLAVADLLLDTEVVLRYWVTEPWLLYSPLSVAVTYSCSLHDVTISTNNVQYYNNKMIMCLHQSMTMHHFNIMR